MTLTIGKWKSKDLADWFGIGAKSFSNSRAKKLNELKKYCDFEDNGSKGITIKQVYIDEYSPRSARSTAENHFQEEWDKNGEHLNTCKDVADNIYLKHGKEIDAKESSIYNAVCIVKRERYGVATTARTVPGTMGTCKRIMCAVDNGRYRHFTAEEEEIRKKICSEMFKDESHDVLMLADAYKHHEITKEEFCRQITASIEFSYGKLVDYLDKVSEAIGFECKIVTELEPNPFLNNDNQEKFEF